MWVQVLPKSGVEKVGWFYPKNYTGISIANTVPSPITELLQILVRLIEEYESKNHPMGESSPHLILQHLMDAREIKQSDLVGIIGSKGVVSEIFNGKRSISKAQAKALGDFFHVSPELFI